MSNYRRGADYERWLVRKLKKTNPILVVRSAGSKSIADVVEIRSGVWVILWQLKVGRLSLSKKEILRIQALTRLGVDVRIANKTKVNGRLFHSVYELGETGLELVSAEPYKNE